MRKHSLRVAAFFFSMFMMLTAGCSPASPTQNSNLPGTGLSPSACAPTIPDMLGPFYEPGAPVRDKVGEGYVLRGTVRSAADCSTLENAQVEFWMAGPDARYTDVYRGVVYTREDGSYQFESHFPPPYSGRPPHIHIRVIASGYRELVTQHYPQSGAAEAEFDLVLEEQ
jgi:protocatechuate 3,4-dioxygenase beta subunit